MKIKLVKEPSKDELAKLVRIIKNTAPNIGTGSAVRTVDLWLQAGFIDTWKCPDPYLLSSALFMANEQLPHLFEVLEEVRVDPFAEENRIWMMLKDAVEENDGVKALEVCRYINENPGFGSGYAG